MNANTPHIAVVYATEQGSTRDIAEFIAATLTERGAVVELADVEHAPDLSRFGTVVLGSAIHNMELLPAAAEYVRTHRAELRNTDVWLFSVGLGPALRGPIGRWVGRTVPKKIAALRDSIAPHDYHAFAGHYDRAGVSLKARTIYRLMGGGRYGDLRDWADIRAWSATIAQSLGLPQPRSTTVHP
ncbi:flavodoxin domain-containing protein [Nocardia sp. CS682]|uniref:flavodoxin domain-containing protein n=1 Tax=Nocardia sp. CS682 TaxID=1047172 RepID=UPI001074F711|nr:flavodoxin domain-containing protein [Nocardia sp. CS682]QBS45351.1 flavodoxin [Nocardia sp. CS682]